MKTLYKDEDIVIEIQFYFALNGYGIHTKVNKWSLSKYKKYLTVFGIILSLLEKQGITKLYAVPPSEKEEKWEKLFGFKDSGLRSGKYKIMELNYGN